MGSEKALIAPVLCPGDEEETTGECDGGLVMKFSVYRNEKTKIERLPKVMISFWMVRIDRMFRGL